MTRPNDDTAWVARCLRGESAAFEPLVERYQRVVFTVALRMVGNYEDARDVTQNAFVRAYERLETYDPKRPFFSWLYRIAVNESLNLRRGQRPSEPLAETLEAKGGPTDAVEARELGDQVQAALMRLSAEQRAVIVLRHFADLSYEEIGEALGVPDKTVKSRLFEARRRLGELLAASRDGGPPRG